MPKQQLAEWLVCFEGASEKEPAFDTRSRHWRWQEGPRSIHGGGVSRPNS